MVKTTHEGDPGVHAPTGAESVSPRGLDTETDRRFLEDMVETRGFDLGKAVGARFLDDGSQILFLRAAGPRQPALGLHVFDVASGQTRELITAEDLLGGGDETLSPEEKARRERMRMNRVRGIAGFQLSRDNKSVLLGLSGRIYLAAIDQIAQIAQSTGSTGKSRVIEVAQPDAKGRYPFDERLSPDGKWVSFVRGGELWVVAATGGKARQLTRGAGDTIQHAQAEFIAQEEMGRYTGYWWSPDSKSLVYQKNDSAKVESLYLADLSAPFVQVSPRPYPRPGTPNVVVELGVISVSGGKTTWISWDRAAYPYLARVSWQQGGPLSLVVQSRDQRDLSLLAADHRTGKTRELVHEHDDAWVNLDLTYTWLEDGSGFLWSSERGGGWQLELRAPDGSLVRSLTEPALGFEDIAHIDPEAGTIIVSAATEPVDGALYEIPLAGGAPTLLSDPSVVTRASYAKRSRAHILYRTHEAREIAPVVIRTDGTEAGALPDISATPPFTANVEIMKVGEAPGFWTAIVRPRDFDPGKKYPVLVDVYGGPGTTVVHRVQSMYVFKQWIADHGFIVVAIDNRGTPGRGRDWERAIKNKFAEVPLEDQVAGLHALAAKEPAMDLSRVGIQGWSFGGYMAALAVMRRPDVYKAAVAGAPAVDWLEYDTHYTERYLGVPDRDKDTAIYDQNGLLPYAKDLSRPLLLIHGTADDNVLFTHTLALTRALFRAGKPFEFLPLAGESHAPRDPEGMQHRYERVFTFFAKNL